MEQFKAQRYVHSGSAAVAAPPDAVFPLLCPIREYEWIDGWSCRLIYSDSGFVEEGCVFETRLPGEGPTVWVTTRHDPDGRSLEFIRITPGVKVVKMELQVDGKGVDTQLWIRYTLTALSEAGNALVDELTASGGRALAANTRKLGRLLDHFLSTGTALPPREWPR
jgi:hypothetical protein